MSLIPSLTHMPPPLVEPLRAVARTAPDGVVVCVGCGHSIADQRNLSCTEARCPRLRQGNEVDGNGSRHVAAPSDQHSNINN